MKNKDFLHLLRRDDGQLVRLKNGSVITPFDVGHGSVSRGKRGIAGSMVYDQLADGREQARINQSIMRQITQIVEPFEGAMYDDYNYWAMRQQVERSIAEMVDRGAVRDAQVNVSADGRSFNVTYRPFQPVESVVLNINLNS